MARRTTRKASVEELEPEELEVEETEEETDEEVFPEEAEEDDEVDEFDELEVDEDEEEGEEDEEEEPAPKPVSKRRKATSSRAAPKQVEPAFGTRQLVEHVNAKTGKSLDGRAVRMVLRKLSREGVIEREVGEERTRYSFTGPNDPQVKAVVAAIKNGAAEKQPAPKQAVARKTPARKTPAVKTKTPAPRRTTTARRRKTD